MKSEEEIRKKLEEEIDSYLTCPKFAVVEHANNISTLAWVLDVSDNSLSDMLREAEMSFGDVLILTIHNNYILRTAKYVAIYA